MPERILVKITEEEDGLFAQLFLPTPVLEFLTMLAAEAPEKISAEARAVLIKHGYGHIFEQPDQEQIFSD